MNLSGELRKDLQQHFSQTIPSEHPCSCGAPSHARILLFRVDGQPATAIVPEADKLTAAQLAKALPGARVGFLSVAELGTIFVDSELGHAGPFDNPFGDSVFLDQILLQFDNLVFCPKMSSVKTGQCFRVPTRQLCAVIHPIVLRLVPSSNQGSQRRK